MSARTRRKGIAAASKLLGPEVVVRDYVAGRAHARVTGPAIAMISVFGFAFVVALLLGTFIVPGGVFLIVLIGMIRPPRAVAITDHGLALLARSIWTNRATRVLALGPLVPMPTEGRAVPLGPDLVTFNRKELDRFSAAVAVEGGASRRH